LVYGSDIAQLKFAHETSFINAFEQSRPFETVDLNGRTDRHAAQLVSFGIEGMHAVSLHQGNKVNEEFCFASRRRDELHESLIFSAVFA